MADKILVISAMICFCYMDLCSPIVLIIVVAREFMVSSLRLVAAAQGIVLAAGLSGKVKTASQMVSTVVILLMWITAVIAISKNRKRTPKSPQSMV